MTTAKAKPANPLPKHADHTTTPYTGAVTLDATAVAALLVDLPKGGMRGLRRAGPDVDAVVAELAVAVPADGATAGISTTVYQDFTTRTANLSKLVPLYQVAAKLAEVLAETIAIHEDAREQDLGQMIDAVRSTAKRRKSTAILAPFQQTLAYRAQPAEKAVKTRAKNKAAKAPPAAPAPAASAAPAAPAAGH